MCTRKSTIARILILGCAVATSLGATWTWSGAGADDDWDTCGNWGATACTMPVGYPSTTNDDVTFSQDDIIELIDEEIDDMLIEYDITFDGGDGVTLTVDSLFIKGAASGTTVLTVSGGAELLADGTN